MRKRKEKKPGQDVPQALLTVAQAAVVLGVHRSTAYDLIKSEAAEAPTYCSRLYIAE